MINLRNDQSTSSEEEEPSRAPKEEGTAAIIVGTNRFPSKTRLSARSLSLPPTRAPPPPGGRGEGEEQPLPIESEPLPASH